MSAKASIPSGMRDFNPEQVAKRQYIFSIIRVVFERYGFQPIETPTMENLSTLTGKYGDEGDQLIFKVLNSGDYLKTVREKAVGLDNYKALVPMISEKALRYDLTVPFARYVVMHQNEITFPFKRYQIQNVFRADRPQRGRYREFYQCDADVVGSDSLLNEVDLIGIYSDAFARLGIPITIKINNRKVLAGLAEAVGAPDKLIDITVAIDKLDKIGAEGVQKELVERGISAEQYFLIEKVMTLKADDNRAHIAMMRDILVDSATAQKGLDELQMVIEYTEHTTTENARLQIDFSLARGLNYYTGAIFEVVANTGTLKSSIGGGGRYDDLTGVFGLKGVSGVGISFGADRIYDVLEELQLFPVGLGNTTKALLINFGGEAEKASLAFATTLRVNDISTEVYHMPTNKLAKQFKYADDKKIPYCLVIGEDEMKNNTCTVKDMVTGAQQTLSHVDVLNMLKHA